jgi:hypothetical protein
MPTANENSEPNELIFFLKKFESISKALLGGGDNLVPSSSRERSLISCSQVSQVNYRI